MTREYEYTEKQGFLQSIKITRTEIHTEIIKPDKSPSKTEWFNADYVELLLMIDEEWRTPRLLCKYSAPLRLMDSSKISQMLKGLKAQGLVESRKEGKKHTQWRRTHKFPTHEGRIA
jgi:DNA-binding transcriptional ArsR family regulator